MIWTCSPTGIGQPGQGARAPVVARLDIGESGGNPACGRMSCRRVIRATDPAPKPARLPALAGKETMMTADFLQKQIRDPAVTVAGQSWKTTERPPSTTMHSALMKGASSEARKTAVQATSSGRPMRLGGCRSLVRCRSAAGSGKLFQ